MRSALLFIVSIAAAAAVTGCKKKDLGVYQAPAKTFHLGDTLYNVTSVTRTTNADSATALIAVGEANGRVYTVRFFLDSAPRRSTSLVVGKELQVSIVGDLSHSYSAGSSSPGSQPVYASVDVNAGELSITVPEVWLYPFARRDSVRFSAEAIAE